MRPIASVRGRDESARTRPRRDPTAGLLGCSERLIGGMAVVSLIAAISGCTSEKRPGAEPSPQGQPPASSAEPTLAQVTREVEKKLEVFDGIATGAIVLVRVGARTRVLTLGLADVGRHRRMNPGERFPIQSITKSIVATAVLQLVGDRKLALDDTVEEVVPGLLPQGRRITIRQLLSHRAGLHDPNDEDMPPLARTTENTVIDVAAHHPLEFAPGSSGQYSNVGYEVLGRVVERVTRRPLAVTLTQKVFGPAGMTDSTLLGSSTVKGYLDAKAVDDPYFRFVSASGGVVSTVRDIDRFYTALWGGDLLDPGLVETMTKSAGAAAPFASDYGLGIWLNKVPCGVALGHSGAGPGFNTKAWTLPDAHRSVVVMVNDSDGYTIADSLATAALCP
jgi:D-alanyl-D-alanine carboxypeptidase